MRPGRFQMEKMRMRRYHDEDAGAMMLKELAAMEKRYS